MNLRRVGILRGGNGHFHNQSVLNGSKALEHFFENLYPKYKPFDIFLDKNNNWYLNGVLISPSYLVHKIDIAWNLSHPNFSQDLRAFNIPVLCTGSFNYAISSSRDILMKHMKDHSINIARHIVIPVFQKDIDKDEDIFATKKARDVFEKFPSPWFVYPYIKEQNFSPFLAKTFPELIFALKEGAKHKIPLVVEEFISEKNAEVHFLKNFRDKDLYSFGFLRKENIKRDLSFSKEEKEIIDSFSNKVIDTLPSNYYIKLDIVLSNQNKPFLKNITFVPDLTEESFFTKIKDFYSITHKELLEAFLQEKNML